MKYIHVRKLEEYHPGYKDRSLIWCKAYFKMMNTDPDFEMLCETDKWRFIAFVMLELQLQAPIPINEEWLARKGFNFKKRSISLTLQMLHNSIDVVTEGGEVRSDDVKLGCIYFLKSVKKDAIKIGYTMFIDERIKSLNRKNDDLLQIMKVIEGTIQDENEIHSQFSDIEILPEWYRPEDKLLKYIDSLQGVDIAYVTQKYKHRTSGVTQSRVEKSRVEESREDIPPPLSSIKDFFKKLNKPLQADPFFNHYEANGWKVGKVPMRKWKAAARNWAGREFDKPKDKEEIEYREFDKEKEIKVDHSPEGMARVSELIKKGLKEK